MTKTKRNSSASKRGKKVFLLHRKTNLFKDLVQQVRASHARINTNKQDLVTEKLAEPQN